MIKGKVQVWWYDVCATVHVSYDKTKFETYYEFTDEQEVQKENKGCSRVIGISTSLMGRKLCLLMHFMFPT